MNTSWNTSWIDNEHPALRRCWHPVARSADVGDNQPVAVDLLGERWCLVRLGGRLAALRDPCPHRYSPLSAGTIVGDTLRCAYHGLRFTADGTCVEIPAVDPGLPIPARACATAAAGVAESLDLVWLAPEDPIAPLPEVPEHHDPSFVNCPLEPSDWNAGAAQMADNFLDLGHLPFVHLATFGDEDDKLVRDYKMQRDGGASPPATATSPSPWPTRWAPTATTRWWSASCCSCSPPPTTCTCASATPRRTWC